MSNHRIGELESLCKKIEQVQKSDVKVAKTPVSEQRKRSDRSQDRGKKNLVVLKNMFPSISQLNELTKGLKQSRVMSVPESPSYSSHSEYGIKVNSSQVAFDDQEETFANVKTQPDYSKGDKSIETNAGKISLKSKMVLKNTSQWEDVNVKPSRRRIILLRPPQTNELKSLVLDLF